MIWGKSRLRNRTRPKRREVSAACQRLLQKAIVYARQNSWLRLFGRALLRAPMIGSALRLVQARLLPPGRRVWVRVDSGLARGLWLQVDPYREQAYLQGNAEPEVQDALATYLKPHGCFFDVGAHIGVHSLIACRLVGARGRVVAFEPDPRNAQLIREHALRNGFRNISVAQVAAWRFDGEVCFRRGGLQPTGQSSRRGAVVDSGPARGLEGIISVRAVSLDRFAAGSCSPDVIKIDVEGAEAEVLEGATGLLTEAGPTLICEVHHAEAAAFIEDFLRARRYRAQWMPLRYEFPFPRHLVATPHQR